MISQNLLHPPQVSSPKFMLCIAILTITHVLDLTSLPFAVMSDSFAYISWGLDVTNSNTAPLNYSFEPRYQDFPYFPLGYPLIIGTIALIDRLALFDILIALQHLLLIAAIGLGLNYLRPKPIAYWVFFTLAILAPELHSYPQTVMSEGIAMSLHLIILLSVLSLRNSKTSCWTVAAVVCAFAVTAIRGTPLIQLPIWCAIAYIAQKNLRTLSPIFGAMAAGALMVSYTYFHTGYPSLTTSDGFHLHNRLVFSQNLPLHLNPQEKMIVDAIGEETYRKPHWFVVDALYEKLGMKQGPAVNKLLADASKPYIWIAPVQYFKNTLILSLKSLWLNNDILLDYSHGWPIEVEAKAREIRAVSWWYKLIDNLPGMRGNIIGPLFIVLCIAAIFSIAYPKARPSSSFYLAICYAAVGLLVASSLSLDDYRRVREFFPIIIFAASIAIQRTAEFLCKDRRSIRPEEGVVA